MTRRYAMLLAACLSLLGVSATRAQPALPRIDRYALVVRHEPQVHGVDVSSPFSVGNGNFAFTADFTGLQTFADAYTNSTPLGTLSQWGWHSFPNPKGWSMDKFHYRNFSVFGRMVGYDDVPGNIQTPEIKWLRENPHRLDLGRISFLLTKSDGTIAQTNDLTEINQTLDLWNGVLRSHFKFDGQPVDVETICHPDLDLLSVHVISPLLTDGRLRIELHFPYGTPGDTAADWEHPDAHETLMHLTSPQSAEFTRTLDHDVYHVSARWNPGATLANTGPHQFVLTAPKVGNTLDFSCGFSPTAAITPLPDFLQTASTAATHWNNFWSTGGAIDLSLSKDPRWHELERRIVLSQYLTAIQCAGDFPPAETGLTCNSWGGKFHLEMHWWHSAHFALWNRLPLLERSLGYYQAILPRAQDTAKRQGHAGARWPKMTSRDGFDSPSSIGPFLIWQQPHPIFFAELCYRAHSDRATLEKFEDVVNQTAEFMASYPVWQEDHHRFVLGPVLQCSQEIFPREQTLDPTFELTYWRWGLETAQEWRVRLGQPRNPAWDNVLTNLAVPAVEDNKYLFAETATGTYTDKKWITDHPSVTASLGMLPGPGVDRETMRRTFHWILDNWDWPSTWGWDYPMLAMCAARLGEPDKAIDMLLLDTPKNHYSANGHNYQRPGLPIYLPANGGLLYATAMMAAGWDGAPTGPAPGFPKNGQWTVRYEGLSPAP